MSTACEFLDAIKQNNIDKVKKMLMEKKHNFTCTDAYGENALTLAFSYKRNEIIKLLLEYGAPVDASDKAINSLNQAILLNDAFIVQTVIKKGVDPNKFWNNNFCLFVAKYYSFEVIMALLDNGANVNIKTTTNENFLHMMVSRGDMMIIERLLNSNIEKNMFNNHGMTPIMLAIMEHKFEIIKYLYERGCTTIVTDKHNCLTMCIDRKNMEMARFFLEKGAPVNKMNVDGVTPLLAAAKINDLEMAMLMIERGADPNLFGPKENSPVYEAIKNKNVEMTRFLLENSADPNKTGKDGKSAVDLAYEVGDPKIEAIFDELYPCKYTELKGLMCFDEIEHSEFPMEVYMKSPNNIIIKNGDNFKGYNRKDIVEYLNKKGTFYSQEKISKEDITYLRDGKIRFFELINTGVPVSILVPYSDESFVTKHKK